eukprot:4487342-Pleurochrysis_carterae.AAC.1
MGSLSRVFRPSACDGILAIVVVAADCFDGAQLLQAQRVVPGDGLGLKLVQIPVEIANQVGCGDSVLVRRLDNGPFA